MLARIAFFSWSVFGPSRKVIQSDVVSSMILSRSACACAEYGVVARKSAQLTADVFAGTR